MTKLEIGGHGHEFMILDFNSQDCGFGFRYGYDNGDGDGYGFHGSEANGWGSGFGLDDGVKITQDGNPSDF